MKKARKPKRMNFHKHITRLRLLNFTLLFGLVGVLLLFLAAAAPIPGMYGSVEQDQVNRINYTRSVNGRGGLQHIECLNTVAERWTERMVAAGGISHNPNVANEVTYICGGAWSIVGENVGVGYSSEGIFNAFMNSPGHQANILDGRFTKAGLGAYWSSDGRLFITQVFANCSSCTSAWNTNATLPADPVAAVGGWSGWESLGGVLYDGSAPAASSWGSGRLDVFVRGTGNGLYQKYFNGTWSGWISHGGVLTSSPAAVSWGPNRIDVFAKSKNNTLIHKWYDGRWSGWEDLGGSITDAPTASSWGNGRLDVFVRGSDGALHHKWYDGRWSGWESLGGQIIGAPTAVSWGSNRIDIFVRDTNNAVQQKYFNGTWSGWVQHGGVINEAPAVSSWGNGRLDVFARGTTNSLYQKYYSGSWSGWTRLDGYQMTSAPTAVSWGSGRVDVFARGPNGELSHKWYPN
jgi:hypothetical protein